MKNKSKSNGSAGFQHCLRATQPEPPEIFFEIRTQLSSNQVPHAQHRPCVQCQQVVRGRECSNSLDECVMKAPETLRVFYRMATNGQNHCERVLHTMIKLADE